MKNIVVTEAAKLDIRSERQYYNRQKAGLGHQFVLAVKQTLDAIQRQPEAMQVLKHEIRRWPVGRFPHGVMYRITEKEIVVVAVFGTHRNPEHWESRAKY